MFVAGDTNPLTPHHTRIPGFVAARVAQKEVLVACAEARIYSVEDTSPHALVVKRSLDSGLTWLPLQTAVDPAKAFGAAEGGPRGGAVFDPTPVVDTREGAATAIHIIFSYQPARFINYSTCNTTGPESRRYIGCRAIEEPLANQLFSVSSHDAGETWGLPRNLTALVHPPSTWCQTSAAGGGNGIQLQRGRLVVPGYHGSCACLKRGGVLGPACLQSHVLIADEYNAQSEPMWRLGSQQEFFPGSAEGSLVGKYPVPRL